MGCCHHYFEQVPGGSDVFTVQMPRTSFGPGALDEVGPRALAWGMRRAALLTDAQLADSPHVARVRASLRAAGIEFEEYSEIQIEPGDRSTQEAAAFIAQGAFDGLVSVGGGSVLDTAKGALVYSRYPASFQTYFAKPIGDGVAVPGPVLPHIACPTTGGTGSEMTGLAVIRIEALATKFVLASRFIVPDEAIIDPSCAATLPSGVMAASGFDCLSHAIECYTARAFTRWPAVGSPNARPAIQGANPWSDLHAREALRLVGLFLERAVADADDHEARGALMWAASLAGMAFGNTGTHLPHALSYAVSHLVESWRAPDYPPGAGPFVPHGISVAVNAPSVFRWTAEAAPERHLEAAVCLGADTRGATPQDAGEVVAQRIIALMRATAIPNGIGGVGFAASDAPTLADSALRQARAIGNAPRDCGRNDVEHLFANAVRYW